MSQHKCENLHRFTQPHLVRQYAPAYPLLQKLDFCEHTCIGIKIQTTKAIDGGDLAPEWVRERLRGTDGGGELPRLASNHPRSRLSLVAP
eukprot:CAMPEP_0177781528 /NCGR_PEP_ID=MMETSP0491_2-20121128/17911_1 /TAXON_ID=63592 /ORGANISM="Tetraselmis chuii, Strain PLY429" /LENGTH=89 /DNA_ID=CAMNT_0019301625 /DNA_START=35 /DNA_END=304 /DNA_ORIENTATION=-